MWLEKLEIHGFKSFKDKTVLEFPDRFTAIVGPNGSGKSNIIDSICFVLGRSRGLRVNNMAELICNGGINGKPSDFARVSMFLRNENGKRTKVTREITRDGRSIYKLDDRRTTRQEIIDLVGDFEYNIILQDDVTKLIDMHPKQRREIIDDLCGIREYDEKKQKALKELEKVENRISETRIVLGEKEGYLKQLKKERDEALKYQELQRELGNLKASILHKNISKYRKKLESLESEIDRLNREREDKRKEMDKIRGEIEEMNSKLKEINAEILRIEEKKGGNELQMMRENLIRLENQLQNSQNELENLKREISEKLEKKRTLENEIRGIESKLNMVDSKLERMGFDINKEMKRLPGVELEDRIDNIKSKIFELHSKVNLDIERNEKGLEELKELENKKLSLNLRIKELLSKEKELTKSINDRIKENKHNFQMYEEIKEKIPLIERKRDDIINRLSHLRVILTEKRTRINTLESSTWGLRGAISAIMRLKKVMDGIHGTVSQLGNVTNKDYETALNIAAGKGMEYIVVENEDVATKCIEYLRNKRIGRATFLPLNRLHVKLMSVPPKGSLGFVRDFIKTRNKFRSVFDYIFGNTILVENLESAKKIGIGKWRMVTLDGDLLLPSGAMTGGYLKRDKIALSFSFSNTEELEREIKALEREIIELDGEEQKLRMERKKLEERLSKLELLVDNGKTDIERIKLEKGGLMEKRDELREDIKGIDARILEIKRGINERNKEIKSIERDIKTLEKNLEELISKRSKSGIEKLERLRENYRNLEVERGRLDEKRNILIKQIDEINTVIRDLEKNISTVKSRINENRDSYNALKNKINELENKDRAIIKELELITKKRAEIEDAIGNVSSRMGEIEYSLNKINDKLNKTSIDKAKFETKLSDLAIEFEKYKDYEIVDGKITEMESRVSDIEKTLESFESVNLRAIKSYDILKNEIQETTEKIETLKNERDSIFEFMDRVEKKKREVFMEAFDVVNRNFERIYGELSGGKGKLTLDNPRDISESGLIINASPKGKKLVNIDVMSGGEKVVTCSAFLLAIQQYKPSHFYIVDEIDAALDIENSIKLAKMLKESDSQFLMITHNEPIIKHAKSVIGVTMNNGISEIVGVKLN